MNNKQETLTQKTWFTVVTLIIFFPVGLYFMWKNNKFNKPARVIITVVLGIAFLGNLVNIGSDEVVKEEVEAEDKTVVETETDVEEEPKEEIEVEEVEEEIEEVEVNTLSVSEEQALSAAENYISMMPFSKEGLKEQLDFEGYESDDIDFAVNEIEVDWMLQAEKAAHNYLDMMPYSRSELIEQLKFEGYTDEQATHGVDQTGL